MPGTHPARRCRLSPRTSLTRLVQKLLEQPAQFERRALAAVAHDRYRDVARAVDLPVANRRAAQSWIALRSTLAALSPRASSAALAAAGDDLPAVARTRSGVVARR